MLLLIGAVIGFGAAYVTYHGERQLASGHYYPEAPEDPKLAWLKHADPLADFQVAASKSDFRFIGVYGGALNPNVPGVKEDPYSEFVRAQGVRYLPTSASCVPEINRDLRRADSYASCYNTLIRQHLKQ